MLRTGAMLLLLPWAVMAGSPAWPQTRGESLFYECEFKAAAREFARALISMPQSAELHFWLGKSYAHLADVSGPWSARKHARAAQKHLEAAVRLDPANQDFVAELFQFYLDSPEWFGGGLDRAAALLEKMGPDDGGPASRSMRLADARKEYSGAGWAMAQGPLRLLAAAGYLIPQR